MFLARVLRFQSSIANQVRGVGVATLLAAALVSACADVASATPVETMIQDTFGYIAAEGHDPRLPMGVQTAPDELGERFLQFVDHGRIVHAFAQGPFAFVTEDGRTRSVDTSLAAVPGGWKPTSVPFSVTIPNDLSTGVVWQDGGAAVRIYPQNVNRTPGASDGRYR